MDIKKWLVSGLAGGVVFLILGFLIYGMLLSSYMETQNTVAGSMRDEASIVWWALIAGHLIFGLLYSYIFVRWAGIKTFVTGAKAGAVIGILINLGYDLVIYGTMNVLPLTMVMIDAAMGIVMGGIMGGVVGLVIGKMDDD